jgi:hypothetical protein
MRSINARMAQRAMHADQTRPEHVAMKTVGTPYSPVSAQAPSTRVNGNEPDTAFEFQQLLGVMVLLVISFANPLKRRQDFAKGYTMLPKKWQRPGLSDKPDQQTANAIQRAENEGMPSPAPAPHTSVQTKRDRDNTALRSSETAEA